MKGDPKQNSCCAVQLLLLKYFKPVHRHPSSEKIIYWLEEIWGSAEYASGQQCLNLVRTKEILFFFIHAGHNVNGLPTADDDLLVLRRFWGDFGKSSFSNFQWQEEDSISELTRNLKINLTRKFSDHEDFTLVGDKAKSPTRLMIRKKMETGEKKVVENS